MNYVKNDAIRRLIELQDSYDWVVSIYMPTHISSTPSNVDEDRIRFKNAYQKIKHELKERGVRRDERERYKQMAEVIYDDIEFWRYRDKGLAVFITPNELEHFDTFAEVEEIAAVESTFVLAPLIVMSGISPNYFVLDLNLKQPKLFKASIHKFDEVNVEDMPKDLATALRISEFEQEQQHHSLGGSLSGSGNRSMFHGHGAAKDNKGSDIVNYFRLIDKSIKPHMGGNGAELIIAGTPKHTATYKRISEHSIADIAISGNYQDKTHDLKEKVEERLRQKIADRIAAFDRDFAETSGSKKAAIKHPDELKSAAETGKIKSLGISLFDITRDKVGDSMKKRPRLELGFNTKRLEEIEELAQSVFKHGGQIIGTFLKDGDSRLLQAIYRY